MSAERLLQGESDQRMPPLRHAVGDGRRRVWEVTVSTILTVYLMRGSRAA